MQFADLRGPKSKYCLRVDLIVGYRVVNGALVYLAKDLGVADNVELQGKS